MRVLQGNYRWMDGFLLKPPYKSIYYTQLQQNDFIIYKDTTIISLVTIDHQEIDLSRMCLFGKYE